MRIKAIMKRLLVFLFVLLSVTAVSANGVIIYEGPRAIGDWGTVELSSIKFHDLEIGDTIYVYTSQVDSTSKGSFQDHQWHTIPGVINGEFIAGDFELVVQSEELLEELKKHGLKVRGENYVVEKIAIKHGNRLIRTIITIAVMIILVVILGAIVILLLKNRQLRKVNRGLYMRNLDILAAADHERRIRAHYEGQIEAFKEMIQNGIGEGLRQKYQNSSLDDDSKAMLTNRILKLFEDSEEIFAEDFNMQKLASLVASNYNNVSQVINEQFGKNFSQLLNEYRIKEACRRLSNVAQYGNHTIESIGNSVGYGSRSTFITQFKALTGLTPSEFQRQARD